MAYIYSFESIKNLITILQKLDAIFQEHDTMRKSTLFSHFHSYNKCVLLSYRFAPLCSFINCKTYETFCLFFSLSKIFHYPMIRCEKLDVKNLN